MIHLRDEPRISENLLEKEGAAKLLSDEASNIGTNSEYKFKKFNEEKWNETQTFILKDSNKSYFK